MMSTKNTLFYFNSEPEKCKTHFFEDVADGVFHITKEQVLETDIKLTLEEVCGIARAVNFSELERQAKLTDEQIENFVKSDYASSNANGFLSNFWKTEIYGDESLSYKERHEKGLAYYKSKRNEIKNLYHLIINSSKVYKMYFGLEDIR
jgi:hypothetical protein